MTLTNHSSSSSSPSSGAMYTWPFVVFLIISALIYGQTWGYEYVLDDKIVITDNEYTQKGIAGVWDILSTESFQGYFGEQKDLLPGARYRPLSLVTFAVEQSIFGGNPDISHVINYLLYALTGMLIYRVLLLFWPISRKQKWYFSGAFLIALLWVAHPIHTEAVANIKGRDEILSFLFSLSAMLSSYHWLRSRRIIHLILASASIFLGLLAKESAITFVGIIPVGLYFLQKEKNIRQLWSVLLALSATAVLYLSIRYAVIGYFIDSGKEMTDIMNNPFLEMRSDQKYATIFYTLLLYLKLCIWPHPLTHDYYPYQIPILDWGSWQALCGLLSYVALTAMAVYGYFKNKLWGFGIVFYLMSLSIASNLLINVGTFMNERFIYAASLGIMIAVVYGVKQIDFKTSRVPFGELLLFGVIGLFVGLSAKRVPAWKNTLSLNTAAIQVSTDSARANSFMATALYKKIGNTTNRQEKQKLINDVRYYADRAAEILPDYQNANLMSAGAAAEQYKLDQDVEKLLDRFYEIGRRRPDIDFIHQYCDYLADRANPNALYNFYTKLGYQELHKKQGRHDWAAKYLNYAYELFPDDYQINVALSQIHSALGNENYAAQYGMKAQNIKASQK